MWDCLDIIPDLQVLLIVDLPCFGSMEKTGAFENNSRKIFFNLPRCLHQKITFLLGVCLWSFFLFPRLLSAGSRIRSLDEPVRVGPVTSVNIEYIIGVSGKKSRFYLGIY
ncbi:hypothetical protein ACN38_g588 [Penicillium nordicum]|uniref:Uncharacterized protein n=1 Tax=Penicillium nordicum TaxID=229535 RepID=A0A0M8PA68_9EURO|nr:hypothetical protein ACN38_g588 [Penicillium nordicum]